MHKTLLLISVLTISGCSTIGPAVLGKVMGGGSDPMLGVDTEIVAGDKTQAIQMDTVQAPQKFDEVELSDNANMTITSKTQKGNRDIKTDNYTEGIPYWQAGLGGILFLIIGIFMPQLIVKRR